MQPDDESEELRALLHEEYGAPPLDDEFSRDLVARLQAEAAVSAAAPRNRTSSPLVICLAIANVAALVFAVVWIANSKSRMNHVLAHREQTDSTHLSRQAENQIEAEAQDDRAQRPSKSGRPHSLSLSDENRHERESLTLHESQRSPRESESKNHSEAAPLSRESRAHQESKPGSHSPSRQLSALDVHAAEGRSISAAAALADRLYVVDGGHLVAISPNDGSRRRVGSDDWPNTATIGAAGGMLYIVSDNQLYDVHPTTGARRRLGKPDWASTTAIITVGDKLYIASQGLLHRVNPQDGSHELWPSQSDRPNKPREPQP